MALRPARHCRADFILFNFPIIVIIPLSFNAEAYFTFTKKMLSFDLDGYSLKWYNDFFSSLNWQQAVKIPLLSPYFPPYSPLFSAPWRRWDYHAHICRFARC